MESVQPCKLGRTLFALCLTGLLLLLGTSMQAQSLPTVLLHGHRAHLAAASAFSSVAAPVLMSTDPVPIPGGDMFIPPTVSHIFAPGPVDQGFDGFDIEPNGITNFRGLAALAYVTGNASDSDGNSYFMFSDMRLFQGEYVASDGSHHVGTFVFIWIDFFDPSSGSQVFDFNGHIRQSGLFWIVQVPDSAVTVNGNQVSVHLTEANVVDNGVFAGPKNDFAAATFDITWNATGAVQHYRPESSDPTDPTNFAAEFRSATVTGSFSVIKGGTTFTASGTEAFAEMGTERNGFFVQQ